MSELTFNSLSEKRKRWVSVNKENKFDEGINRLLTELYPDNAHFIYELLQNAEDAGATEVSFVLESNAVWFEHNGRSFELKDIEAITSIGNSTKRDDPTAIGKFGVGFKAVFAYTKSPVIYSGNYAFKISDLVVPEKVEIKKHKNTRFYFPFDHAIKSKHAAFSEVKQGLDALTDNSVLFLNNIKKINYFIGDDYCSIERRYLDEYRVEVVRNTNQSALSSFWLRFDQEIEHKQDDGNILNLYGSIAYRLENTIEKQVEQWKVVPINGQVSIFFPAEKETSNLKFHIHAPFESTVARDSIRDTPINDCLRDILVERFVESVSTIKDMGLLTVDFLAVLPNDNDNLSTYYELFRDEIVDAFNEQRLLPMRNKGYQCASDAFMPQPAKIASAISDRFLARLKKTDSFPTWSIGTKVGSREDCFIKALNLTDYSYINLYYDLLTNKNLFNDFVTTLDEKRLLKFYELLGDLEEAGYGSISGLKIIKTRSGTFHSGGEDDRVYRLTADQEVIDGHNILIPLNESKYQGFFDMFNIVPLDSKQLLVDEIRRYDRNLAKPGTKHIKIMRSLMSIYNDLSSNQKDVIRQSSFLLAVETSGRIAWKKPNEIYIDLPFIKTGLSHFFPVLHESYESLKGEGFFQTLGVRSHVDFHKISIRRFSGDVYNELVKPYWQSAKEMSSTVVSEDWDIKNREEMIESNPAAASLVFWNAIIKNKYNNNVLQAKYRPNAQYPTKSTDSTILRYLMSTKWLEANDGHFYKPEDMTEDMLCDGYEYDADHFFLKAIKFGEKHTRTKAENIQRDAQAKALGLTNAREAEELAALAKEFGGVENLKQLIATSATDRSTKPTHTGRVVRNPERRMERLLSRNASLDKKQISERVRTVQLGSHNATKEAKAYLRDHYTSDGKMLCQCCDNEMPFKVKEDYYFEAVDCVKNVDKHYQENKLALCPTCAAMYQYANQERDAIQGRVLGLEFDPKHDDIVELPVRLADKRCKITFATSHFYDLKTTLADLE